MSNEVHYPKAGRKFLQEYDALFDAIDVINREIEQLKDKIKNEKSKLESKDSIQRTDP